YKVIKTDLRLNGKHVSENSGIELSSADYQKHKKDLAPFLIPFFDDTDTEFTLRPFDGTVIVDNSVQQINNSTNPQSPVSVDEPSTKQLNKSTNKRSPNKRSKKLNV
ncbi:MAG: hypothetical protein KKD86_04685, partial [Bacteroidetes bacterium]|nr:hypothetical protein [Bacteroidota bacterium]